MSDLRVVVEMAGGGSGNERVRRLVVRDGSGRIIPCSGVIWTRADELPALGTDGMGSGGGGGVLWRSGLDFGGADLRIATQLLSVLASIHRRFVARGVADAQPSPGTEISLTPREHTMLEMLSQGLTADAIGRRLSVTVKTVRKHLEHIYSKLGVHDRLLAVERARAEGLLEPWAPAARAASR
ncbi:MAG: LuxR C-terminal-related transcriptional regulator [Actinobacteria bacterium]|nr:LuxR C-terminal-related transcriptional regulator [Actinomycetota bacterium]